MLRTALALVICCSACTPAAPEPVVVPVASAPAPTSAAPSATASVSAAPKPSAAPVAGSLPSSHAAPACNPGEKSFFSCTAREGKAAKKITVCGADLGKPGASLAIVYGDAAKTEGELRLPLTADGEGLRYARYTRPRVTMLHLSLATKEVEMEVTADTNEEGPKLEWSSELKITSPGKPERTLSCTARSKESLIGLEDFVKLQDPWF